MNIKIPTHDSLSAALLSRAKHGSVIIGLDEIDLAQLGITQSTPVSAAFAAHGFATTDPATSTTTAHDPATADFATADPAAHALATADIATSTTTAHDPATASPYTARRLRLTQRGKPSNRARSADAPSENPRMGVFRRSVALPYRSAVLYSFSK